MNFEVISAMPYFKQVQIGKLSYADFGCKICSRNNSLDECDYNTVFKYLCGNLKSLQMCFYLQSGYTFIVHYFFIMLLLIPKLKIFSWNLSCSPDMQKIDNIFSICEGITKSMQISVVELT